MDHQLIARVLLALFCGMQGIATAIIDLSRTHATHPGWLGHARFHVVWQTCTVLALSIIEIALLIARGPQPALRFYLAATLAFAPMLAFFLALCARRLYAGTLTDPKGMPPMIIRINGVQREIDLNIAAEVIGVMSLVAIVQIFRAA